MTLTPGRWLGIIVLFAVLTLLFVYLIPADSPLSILNYAFGFAFVAFLPGYCLVNLLFPSKEKKIDMIEEIVLSVALSFGIVGLLGLFLGLSPIGINLTSIRFSLAPTVLVLALVAFIRKRQS